MELSPEARRIARHGYDDAAYWDWRSWAEGAFDGFYAEYAGRQARGLAIALLDTQQELTAAQERIRLLEAINQRLQQRVALDRATRYHGITPVEDFAAGLEREGG